MTPVRRWLGRAAALALTAALASCGGGGSDAPAAASTPAPTTSTTPATTTSTPTSPAPVAAAANVLPITVDRGTDNTSINAPFVSVTVCAPGTQTCRTIDHILVDTGSVGLRVESAALRGLALPAVSAGGGGALAECTSFASGFTWGSVRTADVHLGGEPAASLSVQVMHDPADPYATVPPDCANTGSPLPAGGSNGILGVGFSVQDCGPACASSAVGVYFSCATTGCTGVAVPLATQVSHPVAALPGSDNNGLAIVLPDVPTGGVSNLAGSLVLGISSRPNNQLGAVPVFTANSAGNFTTTYKGRTSSAFIDSGSNGIFFADSSIPVCPGGFYCPNVPLSLSATATGTNGASVAVPFVVENAANLPAGTAAADLAGSVILGRSFDWGLPFFFGRTVFVAISGRSTPSGPGPFWAF